MTCRLGRERQQGFTLRCTPLFYALLRCTLQDNNYGTELTDSWKSGGEPPLSKSRSYNLLQAVVLNSEGRTSGELAHLLGSPRLRVSEWLAHYQAFGVEACSRSSLCRPLSCRRAASSSTTFSSARSLRLILASRPLP